MSGETRGAVLVTGSSTGIGRACALHLDRVGFQVFAGVRKRDAAESLAAEASERLEPVIVDVTDDTTIEITKERIDQVTGGRLAGLINNAGVGRGGPMEALDIDDLRDQLEVNVTGQVTVTKAFLPMLRAAKGRVVFISSIGGRVALPYMAPYSASKHAIEAIGDSLRREMRPFGVEVSIVEPGAIATPMWDKAGQEAERVRGRLSPEHAEVYGPAAEAFTEAFREVGQSGIPPQKVAQVVERALTSRRPKTRYLVGRDARFQAILRKWLPDRLLDRGISSQLGG